MLDTVQVRLCLDCMINARRSPSSILLSWGISLIFDAECFRLLTSDRAAGSILERSPPLPDNEMNTKDTPQSRMIVWKLGS